MLVEHHEVVEHAHHRQHHGDRALSWIDMLIGLSRWVMRSDAAGFCAQAEPNGKAAARAS